MLADTHSLSPMLVLVYSETHSLSPMLANTHSLSPMLVLVYSFFVIHAYAGVCM